MTQPILGRLARIFAVASVIPLLTWAMMLVPDTAVTLPPGRVYRVPSGYVALEWERPRAGSVVVTPSRSWSGPGVAYAEGVAKANAVNVPASPNYRVLLVSWRVLIGVPLALCLACAAGVQLQRHRGRRWEARRAAGICPGCGYDVRATPGRCPECGVGIGEVPGEAAHPGPPP